MVLLFNWLGVHAVLFFWLGRFLFSFWCGWGLLLQGWQWLSRSRSPIYSRNTAVFYLSKRISDRPCIFLSQYISCKIPCILGRVRWYKEGNITWALVINFFCEITTLTKLTLCIVLVCCQHTMIFLWLLTKQQRRIWYLQVPESTEICAFPC